MAFYNSLPNHILRINAPQIQRIQDVVTRYAELADQLRDTSHCEANLVIFMGERAAAHALHVLQQAEKDLDMAQKTAHANTVELVNRLALPGNQRDIAEVVKASLDPQWEPETEDEALVCNYVASLKRRPIMDGIQIHQMMERVIFVLEKRFAEYLTHAEAVLQEVHA